MSTLEKIKAKIARNKSVAKDETRIDEIVAETQQKIANSRDVRFLQGELLKQQVAFRKGAPVRRLIAKAKSLQHAARVRRPQASALAKDVFAAENSHGDVLYLSLSNGQLLRADKGHKNPVLRSVISRRLQEDTKDALKFETSVVPSAQ